MRISSIIPMIVFTLLLTAAGLSTDITSCQNITASGEYYLLNNVSNNGTCFNVIVSNVLIDCQGYSITGNGTGYGVYNDDQANVSVKNCVIKNFSYGLGTMFRLAENNTITNFSDYGIYSSEDSLYGTTIRKNTVANATVSDYKGGIFAEGVIENNTVYNVNGYDACAMRTIGSGSTVRYNSITNFGTGSSGTEDGLCLFVTGPHHVYNNTVKALDPDAGGCVNMGGATDVLFENNTVESPGTDHTHVFLRGHNITIRNNFFNNSGSGSIHVKNYTAYDVVIEDNHFYSGINGSSVHVEGGHDVNITGNLVYNGRLLSAEKGVTAQPAYNIRAWNNTVTGYYYDEDTGLPIATGVVVEEDSSVQAWNNTFQDLGKPGAVNRVAIAAYVNQGNLSFYNNTVRNVTAQAVFASPCVALNLPGPGLVENNTLESCGSPAAGKYDDAILVVNDNGDLSITGNKINGTSNSGIVLVNASGYDISSLNTSNNFVSVNNNRVEQRWITRIRVENQLGMPLSGTSVELNSSNEEYGLTSTTGSDGFTPTDYTDSNTLTPIEEVVNGIGYIVNTYNPHTAGASWNGYYNTTQFNVNSSLATEYRTIVLWLNETPIQNCSNLSSPGTVYVLNESILDSNVSQCMNVTANNTILRCEPGVVLEGDYSSSVSRAVVMGNGSGNSYQSLTVRDCVIRGWHDAIYSTDNDISGVNIINVTIQNVSYGIYLQNGTYSDLNVTDVTIENYSSYGLDCAGGALAGVCWNAKLSGITFTGGPQGGTSLDLTGSSCTLAKDISADGEVSLAANQTAEYSNINVTGVLGVDAYNSSQVTVENVNLYSIKQFSHDSSSILVQGFTVNSSIDDVIAELSGGVTLKDGEIYLSNQDGGVGAYFDNSGNTLQNVSISFTAASAGGDIYGIYDPGGNTIQNVTLSGWDGGMSYTGYGYYYDGSAGQSSNLSQVIFEDDNEYHAYVTGGTVSLSQVTLEAAGSLENPVVTQGELYNVQTRPAVDVPSDPAGWTNISTYWIVENVSPTAHANLIVQYTDAAWQNAGVNEGTLTVFEYNGSAWNERKDTVLDAGANTVQLYTDQFSGFGIFGYSDNTPPTVVLNAPANGASINTTSISFNYTPSDDKGLENCSLWTNKTGTWDVLATDTAPDNGTVNTFATTGWTNGTYVWNVQCYDTAGNPGWAASNRTFTVAIGAAGAGGAAGGVVTVTSAPGYDLVIVTLLFLAAAAVLLLNEKKG